MVLPFFLCLRTFTAGSQSGTSDLLLVAASFARLSSSASAAVCWFTKLPSSFCSFVNRRLTNSSRLSFLLQLIRDLHTGTTARVRTSQGMSDVFYTTSGVRQGCILAPALFFLCDWLAHATLFWLFWSRCWQLPSHQHQLRWWCSLFYWWSNEMGLCFSKFWGISWRYGSPHKLV